MSRLHDKLFEHMEQEHGLCLTESEMDDIALVVNEALVKQADRLWNLINDHNNNCPFPFVSGWFIDTGSAQPDRSQ